MFQTSSARERFHTPLLEQRHSLDGFVVNSGEFNSAIYENDTPGLGFNVNPGAKKAADQLGAEFVVSLSDGGAPYVDDILCLIRLGIDLGRLNAFMRFRL